MLPKEKEIMREWQQRNLSDTWQLHSRRNVNIRELELYCFKHTNVALDGQIACS
jgi:hypothetical protein